MSLRNGTAFSGTKVIYVTAKNYKSLKVISLFVSSGDLLPICRGVNAPEACLQTFFQYSRSPMENS